MALSQEEMNTGITYTYKGTGIASNYSCSASINLVAWEIERPSGETAGEDNCAVWREGLMGLTFNCKISPALPSGTEAYWILDPDDFPAGPDTKITWDPWDVANNRPHVGVGTSPKLTVTYENAQSKYTDFMPPDNRWFGQKKITVYIGSQTIIRPLWFFFNPYAERLTRQGAKKEEAWFHYWKENGAIPDLANFEFDFSLKEAGTHWRGTYTIGPKAHGHTTAAKPIFDVNVPNSYSEENYPEEENFGIHNVAKYCRHELWHGILKNETAMSWWGLGNGLGHPDTDGDRLSDAREAVLGTSPNERDTCGISQFNPGDGTDYSHYARYGDQELFCRVQQNGILGDTAKDWSFFGAQCPKD